MRPDLDFSDPLEMLKRLNTICREDAKPEWLAFKNLLTPEQLETYFEYGRKLERHEYALGARMVLAWVVEQGNQLTAEERRETREAGHAREISNLNAQIANLKRKVAEQERQIMRLQAKASPTPAPVAPARPDWDYAPVETKRPNRSEVIVAVPAQVARVADQIEHYVRRQPRRRCLKPDVSAAFPSDRPYLTAAYRHLHASRRVRVNGYQLEAL